MVFVIGQEYEDYPDIKTRHVLCVSTMSDFKISKHVDDNQYTVSVGGYESWKPLFKSADLNECKRIISNIINKHSTLDQSEIIDVNECLVEPASIINDAITAMCDKLIELGEEELVDTFQDAMLKHIGEVDLIGT